MGKVRSEKINLENFASTMVGLTGAQIAEVVNQAAINATLERSRLVNEKHLVSAFDTATIGALTNNTLTAEEKKLIAYHEAGHALTTLLTPHTDEIYHATILGRGNALGYVKLVPSREQMYKKQELFARLDVCYGGRVSEEIFFGEENVTTGEYILHFFFFVFC